MTKTKKYLPDFIFGSIDGLVTTFAVVSGVIGASFSPIVILVLGFANLFADGFSMAISNYLSSQSEEDLHEYIKEKKPFIAATTTFVAFVVVGFVPLIPYIFPLNINNLHKFTASSILTLIAFCVVGYIKGHVTNKNKLSAAVETLLIGSLAAVIAYIIGYMIVSLGIKN